MAAGVYMGGRRGRRCARREMREGRGPARAADSFAVLGRSQEERDGLGRTVPSQMSPATRQVQGVVDSPPEAHVHGIVDTPPAYQDVPPPEKQAPQTSLPAQISTAASDRLPSLGKDSGYIMVPHPISKLTSAVSALS
jgi:hypothetical protein